MSDQSESKNAVEDVAAWTERNKTFVRSVHGTIVGTGVIVAALNFGTHLLDDKQLTLTEASFIGGLLVVGFVASMPWIFMPWVHKMVLAWRGTDDDD